ncbi:hypothetical protein ZPAH7B_orf00025 [Aeromonas phage ZPAH7B]|uniref:Uncharacterized protein n=2 Tax=Aerosvirus ZPAH7 TaxID=2733366 RepID=A0A3Q9GHI0_9CAUD|nr:hypothetical protein HOU89_gp25 [Aeromonas phage ZPAH7]AZQ96406.1 hypothetical protein ZPAH7_orf00025 [Aeromonas phage ZPAH7]QAX95986.1 hypothetical protein ZPAH7B_orf00025 [Aeromonas phage ZPAH7B]
MSKFNVGSMMVMAGAALGALVSDGALRQVGVIRTQYTEVDINGERKVTGHSIEAVLECLAADKGFDSGEFYAVEIHRGVALVNPVTDTEMVDAFVEQLALLDDEQIRLGNHFVYDQEMVTTQEFINNDA